VLILGLLVLDRLPGLLENSESFRRLMSQSETVRRIERIPGEMHNGVLNAEDWDALGGGYYEGLRKDVAPIGLPQERDDVSFRDDFLLYEFKANVKRPYPAGMRITNSLGMPNPEYGYEKPLHTRRIALLGDSISVGPYGKSYEKLLEDHLNQAHLTPEIQKFEVLNFAVYGYSVVQMMDVALEKTPKFHCDVYVLALSYLELMNQAGWRTHVGRLVVSGTNLKYDFLRRVVAEAEVQPTDHLARIRTKLAPFVRPVTRWAVEQIRNQVASEGSQMIVVLVAPPLDPNLVATRFNEMHQAIDGLGVPVIDLRDTFQSAKLDDLQVLPKSDVHPNVRGHEMIFEDLYAKLRAQPEAWAALVGEGVETGGKVRGAVTGK
jgi:hypothetical protein